MRKYITIGELANMFDISTSQIRFYERKKLLSPHIIDENGYRLYDYKQLDLLESILLFREIDISINEIKSIIDNYDIEDYIDLLESAYEKLEKQIEEIERKKHNVKRKLSYVRKYANLVDSVNIIDIEELNLKVISHHDIESLSLKELYDELIAYGFKFMSSYFDIYTVMISSDKLSICMEERSNNEKLMKMETVIITAGQYYIKSFYIEKYDEIDKKVEDMYDFLDKEGYSFERKAVIKEEAYSYSMNKVGSYVSIMVKKQ